MGRASERSGLAPLVMVVEDDEDVRETMRAIFEAEGDRVATATDGQDALELLERIEPPGVILLDLMMPRLSGGDFLETARRRHPALLRVPVVVVTGHAQSRFAMPAVTRTVAKPLDLGALLAIVKQVCRRPPARAPHRHA
ncbi:MAG: response regulator [Deltaproteobacteria bacterium]|nr:response regulator [Deltaproteobacteria bacterium]